MRAVSNIITISMAMAGSFAAPQPFETRDSYQVIGYRAVTKEKADRYNKEGTIPKDETANGVQIGDGAYTASNIDTWTGEYQCVILAKKDRMEDVSKAWVPKTYNGNTLWFKPTNIDTYIFSLENSWKPEKTVRLSLIDGKEGLQLLLVPGLLNGNGGALDIQTKCVPYADRHSQLPNVDVDYDAWHENIKGNRT